MPIRNYASSEAGRRMNPSDAAAYPGGSAFTTPRLVNTSRRQPAGLTYLSDDSPIILVPHNTPKRLTSISRSRGARRYFFVRRNAVMYSNTGITAGQD